MVPIENQERPNIKSVYTCSNCEKALFDGDDDHPILGWIPATPVGSRSALRPTALAVSEGTIRTASGLI